MGIINDRAKNSLIIQGMKIHILPPEVADQIAAGEVVERPASVVKELIENALDADSTNIEVWIEDGGKKLIEVRDNGSGMSADDAEKCVMRHATSKISTIDDVFAIQSYGFRGEALAAISAVSDFELVTRKKEDASGTCVTVECGTMHEAKPAAANEGSIFRVANLFRPTPARLAHLKNSGTEMSAIKKEVQAFAMANPDVSFQLFRDGKNIIDFPAGAQIDRVAQVLGENKANLLTVDLNVPAVKIAGWTIKPAYCSTQKKSQLLWVNGRHIEDHKLAWAVREAYKQTAGVENHMYPKFALWLEIDPLLVDVNVHPRKTEVKFSEPGDIWSAVRRSVVQPLGEAGNATFTSPQAVARFDKVPGCTPSSYPASKSNFGNTYRPAQNFSKQLFNSPAPSFSKMHEDRSVSHSAEEVNKVDKPVGRLRLIGQLANQYILAEGEDSGLWMFDQHALHERQRFEKFWAEKDKLAKERQKLLIPHETNLDEDQHEILKGATESLSELGFELDENMKVLAIPSILSEENIDVLLAEMVDWLEGDQVGEHATDKILRKLLGYKSCRGSVMFGDKMLPEEMQRLLDDFEHTTWRDLCPHGRPNHVFWSIDDIGKNFHR